MSAVTEGGRKCLEYLLTVEEASPWELGTMLHAGEDFLNRSFSRSGGVAARHLLANGLICSRYDDRLKIHLYRITLAGRAALNREAAP